MKRPGLLALAAAVLALPWAGCHHARRLEGTLRAEDRAALAATTAALAAALAGRTDLLYRGVPSAPAAGAASAPAAGTHALHPLALAAAPLVDGYADGWPRAPEAWTTVRHDAQHALHLLTGVHERLLYVLLEVEDAQPVYDTPGGDALDPTTYGDRVWLGCIDDAGAVTQVFLAATGPGTLTARRVAAGEFGERHAVPEPRVRAAWQPTAAGFRVEMSLPRSMAGGGFGVLVDDRDARGAAPQSYGTLRSDDLGVQGAIVTAAPGLDAWLAQAAAPGIRLTVTTPEGHVLARVAAPAAAPGLAAVASLPVRLFERLLEPGRSPWATAASAITDRAHRQVIARLETVQPAPLSSSRTRALAHRLAVTFGVTALGTLLGGAGLLVLALRRPRRG